MTSILLTGVCKPFGRFRGQFATTDHMAFRLTRDQELFVCYEHPHEWGLHLIAQNLPGPSVVLEYPTLDELRRELDHGYDFIGISFRAFNGDMVREMCELIAKKSPKTRIVLGGYGAVCTPGMVDDELARTADVCTGEGVSFVRRLLGEPPLEELHCQLPKTGHVLPWLTPRRAGTTCVVLSGIGCTHQCPFCSTSASTGGRYIEVMNAEQIYRTMRRYWETTPSVQSAMIFDEDFLDKQDKARELSRLLGDDGGLGRYGYMAFASVSAIANYSPEELMLSGVDLAWVGMESKSSTLSKRQGMDVTDAFHTLHAHGIKTIGSMILGNDEQTPESLGEDADLFVSLDPTMQQIALITVLEGTPLHASMKQAGRIPSDVGWSDMHLSGRTVEYKHFQYDELVAHQDTLYRRIYEENGAAVLKILEVNLNGYEACMRSSHPLLRKDRSRYFRGRCENQVPILKTALEFAPTARVHSRLEDLQRRYVDQLGTIPAATEEISDLVLRRARREAKRRSGGWDPYREEPFRRYSYAPLPERGASKPYEVEYPESAVARASIGRAG